MWCTFACPLQINKAITAKHGDEQETIDAFVALGGNADGSGTISTDRLQAVVREFELTLNIAKFIAEVDKENSGTIGYEPFKLLLA
ncbi:uncharacterized protein HaLaN_18648 [Haematococcus lacustris]|uniref:EF-hand domain-containing protein n=1 Tax=Haematococcus lacustris TaxID=44745 RepID=A0A699ZP03_HAELA|nr:uncharacterized protein HaLaN_18648 [Haematococcus lacustris]